MNPFGRACLTMVAVALVVATLLSSKAFAQVDTGTVQGTVRDASGAVVPAATVTLLNVTMGVSFETKTNDVGHYQFPSVRIGSYTIVAEASGFAPATLEGVSLSIQQRYVADFTLKPSNIAETVTVTSDVAALQTQDASLGGVVQSKVINDLPLNGRNYTFLAQLNPGVVQAQQDTRGMGGNGSFSANGQNSFANNYLLDGVDNNSNLVDFVNGAGYVYRPSVDALQEFKVQTSSYSAEIGRASGAVLNASLKSGGEQYRGNVFEFYRNSALDAINFFDEYQGLKKGKFIRNQFGVTLGGPMAFLTRGNKKTFFFADYEGTVARQATTSILTTPTPRMQSSNFTDMSDLIRLQGGTRTDRLGRTFPLGTIMDPATTRFINAGAVDPVTGRTVTGTGGAWIRDPLDPSGNNAIPAGRINQNALNLLKEFPAATRTDVLAGNYAVNPITEDDNHQGDVRIDQYIDANNTMFGRFSAARSTTLVPAPYGGVIDGSQFGGGDQTVKVYSGALSWTRIYSTSLVSETRFGYSSIDHKRLPLNATDNTIAGRFGLRTPDYPYMGGLPLFTVDGIGQFGVPNNLPSIQYQSTYQLSTTFSKLAGNHSWKWGFQFSRPMTEFFQPAAPRGGYGYSGTFTDVPTHDRRRHGHGPDAADPDRQHARRLPDCAATAVAPVQGELRRRAELGQREQNSRPDAARLLAGLVGLHRRHLEDHAEGDGESRTPLRLSAQCRGTRRSRGEPPRGADSALRDGGGSVQGESLAVVHQPGGRRPHRDRMRRQQHAGHQPQGYVRAAPRVVVRVRRRLGRACGRWVVLSDERHVRTERRKQSRRHTADLSVRVRRHHYE